MHVHTFYSDVNALKINLIFRAFLNMLAAVFRDPTACHSFIEL